jgi:hypothetical protein
MQEAEQHQDYGMVSGPAVASFMWFDVSEPMITFSADQDPKRRVAMWHDGTVRLTLLTCRIPAARSH